MFSRVARINVLCEFGRDGFTDILSKKMGKIFFSIKTANKFRWRKPPGLAEQHVGEVFRVILVKYRLAISFTSYVIGNYYYIQIIL